MARQDVDIAIEPYRFSASWIVGACTHFIDRFHPQVELIYIPSGSYSGGRLTLFRDDQPTSKRTHRPPRYTRLRFALGMEHPIDLGNSPIIDLRFENYFNWSHQINRYLPLSLYMREHLVADAERLTVLLPSKMPKLVEDTYRHFGFDVLTTDENVIGCRLGWQTDDDNIIQSHVHLMMRRWTGAADGTYLPHVTGLPTKIFLSRRGTRAISNAGEVEALLNAKGYVTVYAEDHPPLVQMALLRQASAIVAIHGAALGPILYRRPGSDFTLLEILPAGHMTNFYQIMCDQVEGRYCGVRGRIKPEYVRGAYGASPFLKYSLDNFEVDIESVKIALEILRRGDVVEEYPHRWLDEHGDLIRSTARST